MIKEVVITKTVTLESWESWTVSVPDDVDDDTIKELMTNEYDDCELELSNEEQHDDDDVVVDVANSAQTEPDLILNWQGIVEEGELLLAMTTKQLEAELERRKKNLIMGEEK